MAESKVKIIVYDSTQSTDKSKLTFDLRSEAKISKVAEQISLETGYDPSKFDLEYKPAVESTDKTFSECNISDLLEVTIKNKTGVDASDKSGLESNLSKLTMKDSEPKEKAECGICLEETNDWTSLGCSHKFCKNCIAKHLSVELDEKKKSFLDVCCPGNRCDKRFDDATIRRYATEKTIATYDAILKTIPKKPEDLDLTIDDFNYTYNDKGVLVNKDTGERFRWVNQVHYDLLGDLIAPYIQKRMVSEFGLIEFKLPEKTDAPAHVRNNIFMTPDALTNPTRLMLLIQGSGAVRAGQWARALCMNDTLDTGSIFPYLKKAIENKFGVIVFNPNLNKVPSDPLSARPRYQDFFLPGKPKLPEVPTVKIPEHESPPQHTVTVWDQFASKSVAKEIVIVAHSAGGSCTMHLLRERENKILPRLRAVAFTDSVHWVNPKDPKAVRQFISKNAINWVSSEKPLDTPESPATADACACVSSGHPKHEHTSQSAIESVFKFLISKVK